MPATEVSKETIPDNTDADATIFQSTAPITDDVPIIATEVCATVLMARIEAHFNHLMVFTDGLNGVFENMNYTSLCGGSVGSDINAWYMLVPTPLPFNA